jgi:hypothetical protein
MFESCTHPGLLVAKGHILPIRHRPAQFLRRELKDFCPAESEIANQAFEIAEKAPKP